MVMDLFGILMKKIWLDVRFQVVKHFDEYIDKHWKYLTIVQEIRFSSSYLFLNKNEWALSTSI